MDCILNIEVSLPELEIVNLNCQVHRSGPDTPPDLESRLQKLLGIRVGPGMIKIINGLIGKDPGYAEMSFMVEECCHGVILSLTHEELKKAPLEPHDSLDYFRSLVQKNIRLYNRCAAFAPGSPLVEGIEPPT
jgi:hypothetical protein